MAVYDGHDGSQWADRVDVESGRIWTGLGSLALVSSIDFQRHLINVCSSLLDIYRKPHPGIIPEDSEYILPLNLNTKSHDFMSSCLGKNSLHSCLFPLITFSNPSRGNNALFLYSCRGISFWKEAGSWLNEIPSPGDLRWDSESLSRDPKALRPENQILAIRILTTAINGAFAMANWSRNSTCGQLHCKGWVRPSYLHC